MSVTDSLGVRIVTVHTSAFAPLPGLDTAPAIEIGVREGDPAYELDAVRSAVQLRDGTIIIANAGSNEVRVYDGTGRHRRTFGGEGEGPGEFRGLSVIGRLNGDTLYAFDRWLQRITHFDTSGLIIKTVAVEVGPAAAVHTTSTGAIIPTLFLSGMPNRPRGVHADTATLAVYRSDGSAPDTIGRFPVLEWFSHGFDRPPTALPWGRTHYFAVSSERVYVATSIPFEIRAFTSNSTLARIVRVIEPPRPASDADRASLKEQWLSRVSRDDRERAQRSLQWDELPPPRHLPAVSGLLTDAEGVLWVRRFKSDVNAPWEWWLIGPGGDPEGRIQTPSNLTLLAAGRDFIVARRTDQLGVEYIGVYTVRK